MQFSIEFCKFWHITHYSVPQEKQVNKSLKQSGFYWTTLYIVSFNAVCYCSSNVVWDVTSESGHEVMVDRTKHAQVDMWVDCGMKTEDCRVQRTVGWDESQWVCWLGMILRWFVHVECNTNTDWIKSGTAMELEAARRRGLLKKTWCECVKEDMNSSAVYQEEAQV